MPPDVRQACGFLSNNISQIIAITPPRFLSAAGVCDILGITQTRNDEMSEEQAIRAVVHLYVDGMAFANEPALRKAFHPRAAIIGNYQGAVEWMTRDEFIAAIVEEGSAPPGTIPLMEIELIDIEGDAASVKVVDEFAGMRFSDYLSLVKIDGRWSVVNKVYHLHR
ncbi:hypothetical protein GGD45_000048 [Rhizobium tropici]|uniref:Nuclear transport factor 2 family protein n=4 Tax=Rhizobium TaxID=379 RepID=A0ABR6QRV9_RHITR|nr:hypothetical protein [Rhizobium tropici]